MKSIKKIKKLDALRLKKYYSYYIKMNREKSVEDMMKNIMAPLDHMFDDHHLCDSKWCYKKRAEEDTMLSADEKSERMKLGYYRSKTEDLDMYNELKEKYAFYTTEEKITQCRHEFDTQINEGMNTCVAKYTPKSKHYSKSISLEARVKVAAGIFNVGYHFFWTDVMKGLELDIPKILEERLLARDRNKWIKSENEQTNAFKSNRKRKDHANMQKEVDNRLKDITKNMVYGS